MPKEPPDVFREAFVDPNEADNAWTLLKAKYDVVDANDRAKLKLKATTGEPQNRTSSDKNQ